MDTDERNRLKLTAAMQELLTRIQRGSLDPITEARPDRDRRRKFGLIQGGKATAIIAGLAATVRYLREHGTAAGTAAAIAAGAAVVYGVTSGSDRPATSEDIGAAPVPGVHVTPAPATSQAVSVGPTSSPTPTDIPPMPAPIVEVTTARPTASPTSTPAPTSATVPLPDASPTAAPTASAESTAIPTSSAPPDPSEPPATTTPTPTLTPTPGADEPPDQGPRLCLRIRPVLQLCVGR